MSTHSPASLAAGRTVPLRRYPFLILCALMALCALFSVPRDIIAQKVPVPVNPVAPEIAMPVPMGLQRGTPLELTLTGKNLAEPVAILSSIPGLKATFPADNNNGKDAAKLRVLLEAPANAPLGFHTLRLATTRGVSNLRLFCVDDLPQVVKDGKNKGRETAQAIPLPCVVVGQVGAETSDYYKITVQANQRLSFDLLGRRLGSAFDPQIAVINPRNQREVAFSNDAPGLQTDPCATHIFKEAGEYLIEVRDVMHRGGGDFAYRLRVGDFPCATTPIPMAAKRGSKVNVGFAGSNVDGVAPVEVNVPTDPSLSTIWVAPKGASGLHGWPVALAVSDIDETVEQEPNDDPAKANRVPVPGAVTGRFDKKGDVDHFVAALKSKVKYVIEAHTLDMGSPTEVYMVLKDGKGAELAKSNPQAAPRMEYTPTADGDFTLRVEHLHYWGGSAESYRISITPSEPAIEVVLASERFDVPPGGATVVSIQSVAARDYKGPIELTVVGHPGITGSKVIDSAAKAAQPNQPVGRLLVSVAADLPMGAYPVKVVAKAKMADKEIVSYVSVRPAVSAALANLPVPPRSLNEEVVCGVTEKPPFTLVARFEPADAFRGGANQLIVTSTRFEGFDGDIALTPIDLPPGVAPPAFKAIAKGQNEIKGEVKVPANVPLGEFFISFTGKGKHMNKDYTVTALPVPLVVGLPCDLKVEPAPFKIDAGEKAKLKVIATRRGGYKGPIALELKGLPANVTAPKVNIDMDKDDVEVEVSAAANATVGDKADVSVQGTATAAANQVSPSPNFTVTVNKK